MMLLFDKSSNKIEDNTQEIRRAFCRSAFQFVDGISTDLKNIVYSYEFPELMILLIYGEKTINKQNH